MIKNQWRRSYSKDSRMSGEGVSTWAVVKRRRPRLEQGMGKLRAWPESSGRKEAAGFVFITDLSEKQNNSSWLSLCVLMWMHTEPLSYCAGREIKTHWSRPCQGHPRVSISPSGSEPVMSDSRVLFLTLLPSVKHTGYKFALKVRMRHENHPHSLVLGLIEWKKETFGQDCHARPSQIDRSWVGMWRSLKYREGSPGWSVHHCWVRGADMSPQSMPLWLWSILSWRPSRINRCRKMLSRSFSHLTKTRNFWEMSTAINPLSRKKRESQHQDGHKHH